jgi:hypothetical protein
MILVDADALGDDDNVLIVERSEESHEITVGFTAVIDKTLMIGMSQIFCLVE